MVFLNDLERRHDASSTELESSFRRGGPAHYMQEEGVGWPSPSIYGRRSSKEERLAVAEVVGGSIPLGDP